MLSKGWAAPLCGRHEFGRDLVHILHVDAGEEQVPGDGHPRTGEQSQPRYFLIYTILYGIVYENGGGIGKGKGYVRVMRCQPFRNMFSSFVWYLM